jgi:hypothetical protein
VIAGTEFSIQDPAFVTWACQRLRPGIANPSEIEGIQAECDVDRAVCVACEDVMFVFDLRGRDGVLEMFIWLAVAFKYGAFERQSAAMLTIARDLGASTVAFRSRRRGWARRLGPEWHPRGAEEFTRKV